MAFYAENNSPLRIIDCHDSSRYISFLLHLHLLPPYKSYAHPTSSNTFLPAPSHPSQLHPSSPKHIKKENSINSSNSHNSPPNLYTAVHNPVHNASATPTLPSLHNTVHTTPRDPPTPLLHFDQIYNRCDRELFGLCRLEQAFLRSAGERGRLRVGRLGGWIFRFGFFR